MYKNNTDSVFILMACKAQPQLNNISENVSTLNNFFYYKGLHFNET